MIQAKAQRFLGFLNGYTVFLGPLIGLLVCDYWLVRKGRGYNVRALYQPGHNLYWYTAGFNWRAIVAMLVGIVPLVPGLAHSINSNLSVSRCAQAYYTMAWLDGLVLTALTYYILFLVFPWTLESESVIEGRVDVEAVPVEIEPDNQKDTKIM